MGFISSTGVEVKAFAWSLGEEPVEVVSESVDSRDFDRLQYALMAELETKEFGKITSVYPVNVKIEGGELTLLYRAFTDEHRGRQIVSGTDEADLTKAYEQHKQYCAQKIFTPAELYALTAVRTDFDSYHTVSVHLPEIDTYSLDLDAIGLTKRFETRTLVDHDYDGRRGWTLQTVWFDDKPVMVVNSSGRDGDEYHDRWITDGEQFAALIGFLYSFTEKDAPTGFVEASAKIPAMTEFYNHTIHDYYDFSLRRP